MPLPAGLDRDRLARFADGLMVAVAVAMPWSTSAALVLIVLWAFALFPTLDAASLRRVVLTPAGGLPVLLVLFGLVGMAWAEVSLYERWKGFDSFIRLLAIPLLMIQFQRSDRGLWVFAGYVASCVAILAVSLVLVSWPHPVFLFSLDPGVPVRNAPTQSGEFVTCIFGLMLVAYACYRQGRRPWFWAVSAIIALMVVDILFVATGRTALVIMPILLLLFALRTLSPRGVALVVAGAIAVGVVGWFASPYLRARTEQVWTDLQQYEATGVRNSSGERVAFAKKSLDFIAEAPLFGHGTGAIRALFAKAAETEGTPPSANPHNQTFAVAIQLGLAGAAVLWAMWIAHLLLFRGPGLAAWVGLVVVVQNIVGSAFNSHLFDFTQGWVYVIGVGVAGGLVLRARAKP